MIIFDEKAYAEELIKNGYKNKKYITMDNIILVKYWKHLGLNEDQIKEKLQQFMHEFENLFISNNIIGYKVKKAMLVGMKYDLLTNVKIIVTQGELDEINKLPTLETRKMMFVFLVVWKFKGCMKRFGISNTDVMKLSKVKTTKSDIFWGYIYQITQSGLLSMVEYQHKSYYKINLEESGDVVLEIDKYDDVINYYLSTVEPDNYIQCANCSVPIFITTPNKKYCGRCKIILQRQWTKQSKLKKGKLPY